MDLQYRPLQADDIEQAAFVEAVAFYGDPAPYNIERMRKLLPPEWTVGAFVDGRLVADARTLPTLRWMNGGTTRIGCIGPVACLAEHRRQGYVGNLMRLSLERMREQGMVISGLYTPHDGLYQRYGWERAEGKKRYEFQAKDVTLRLQGERGRLEPVTPDEWQRLDDVYRRYAEPRNGPLARPEPWWREGILRREGDWAKERRAFVWLSGAGEAQGYTLYQPRLLPFDPKHGGGDALLVWDLVALTPDAYLGLWQHLLTHDIARPIEVFAPLDDPFTSLAGDPSKVEVHRVEGPMIRIVDVEGAFAARPYAGSGAVSFTVGVTDPAAPWNEGTWQIEAAEERMAARRVHAEPDLEMPVNFLAPLYTGFVTPRKAAETGMLRVNDARALEAAGRAFAVTHTPYCNDWY